MTKGINYYQDRSFTLMKIILAASWPISRDVSSVDKSRHARPDDNDEVGDKTRQMRAKIQGHSLFLMTPFISLYEAGNITKDRRPPTIHFPAGVCSSFPKEKHTSNCIIVADVVLSTSSAFTTMIQQWSINLH